MYTIKQAAARTGVPVELLRAWERRYGIVEPERTASGYRLYGGEDLRRLLSIRQLTALGLPWRRSATSWGGRRTASPCASRAPSGSFSRTWPLGPAPSSRPVNPNPAFARSPALGPPEPERPSARQGH